ncbi:MAG: helix-turn-helix transcriptional regulator [Lentilitoribacter sp.]
MSKKFGEKLRQIRTNKNKTLEELAAGIGSSKAYVWQLENKKNAKPSAEFLLKIANYFDESPDYFIDDSIEERTESHVEEAFFRKFRKLSKDDKEKFDRMISALEPRKK